MLAVPPLHLLNASVVSLGDPAHLAPLFDRVARRKPITLVGIGSSITSRHGGCTRDLSGRHCAQRSSGWLRIFFDHINSTFPSPHHRLYNAGIPASAPSAFAECLTWLSELGDVDLFVLEFVAAANIQELVLRLLSRAITTSRPSSILFALFHRWINPMEAAHNRLMRTAIASGLPIVSQLRGLAPWRDVPWSEYARGGEGGGGGGGFNDSGRGGGSGGDVGTSRNSLHASTEEADWSPAAQCPDGLHPTTARGQAFMGGALSLWLDRSWRRHRATLSPTHSPMHDVRGAMLSDASMQNLHRSHRTPRVTRSTAGGVSSSPIELSLEHRERAVRALGGDGTASRRVTLACFTLDPKRIPDARPLKEALAHATKDERTARTMLRRIHRRQHVRSTSSINNTSVLSSSPTSSLPPPSPSPETLQAAVGALSPDGGAPPQPVTVAADGGAPPRLLSRHGFYFTLDHQQQQLSVPDHNRGVSSPQSTRGAMTRPAQALYDAKGSLAAFCPGGDVEIDVSVRSAGGNSVGIGGDGNGERLARLVRPYVALEYLSSWTGLGRANLTCLRECECAPSLIDAHQREGPRASLRALHRVALTTPIETLRDCVVRLTILPTSSSGEHRFKILRISVGAHTRSSEVAGLGLLPPPDPPSPPPPPPIPTCRSSGLKGDVSGPVRCETFCRAANAPRHCMLCKCSSCPFCSGGRPSDTRQHRSRDLQRALKAGRIAAAIPPPNPSSSPSPPLAGAGVFDADTKLFVCSASGAHESVADHHQAALAAKGTCASCRAQWLSRTHGHSAG